MDDESPTAHDTIANRYFEFLVCCIVEFNQQACLAILVSTDKSNAKTSKLSKYLNKAVDVGAFRGILMRLFVIAMQDAKLLLELSEQVLLQLLILAEDGIFVPFAELERLKAEEHLAHLH